MKVMLLNFEFKSLCATDSFSGGGDVKVTLWKNSVTPLCDSDPMCKVDNTSMEYITGLVKM